MKERELRRHADCSVCGKKIGATGLPLFWRVTVERWCINAEAIARAQGLGLFFGGNAKLAMVMGADEDMAGQLFTVTLSICEACAVKSTCVAALAEARDINAKENAG